MASKSRILVLGYGNPGRRDDGLGPAAAAALEARRLAGVTVESDYQLTVEDAADVATHDVVVFVDAACQGPEPFAFRRVVPGDGMSFSSHSASPEGVLGLAGDLFGAHPEGYVLGIRGYEFNEFGEGLSERARANLAAALAFVEPLILNRTFAGHAASPAGAPAGVAAAHEGHR